MSLKGFAIALEKRYRKMVEHSKVNLDAIVRAMDMLAQARSSKQQEAMGHEFACRIGTGPEYEQMRKGAEADQ